ncbi:MAG: hypothetical protein M3N95_07760 [Actinomycetota bacterium]|nr:hypothetical protein [Actinomycetota bacterium]
MANQIVNFPVAFGLLLFGVAALLVTATVSATAGGIMLMVFGLCAIWLGESVRRKVRAVRARQRP